MKRYIKAETIDNKTYLFRGQSNNSYQSNYSKKHKTQFKSRYYAYELFDGIQLFGNIAVYELSDSASILDYGDSVEQFIEDYDLADMKVPELLEVYHISSLSELSEYGGSVKCDYHDLYHARQLVAIAYLEDNMSSEYDGIGWYEWSDTPEEQVMIWNDSAVRRLPYSEAKQVMQALEKTYADMGIGDSLYTKDWSGQYSYQLARR